jgi:pimeloyl-ACP methyl ester carboxylesterase
MVTLAACADRLVLHPSTYPISESEHGRRRLEIPFGEGVLEVWVARTGGTGGEADRPPTAFVLDFCGNGGRAERGSRCVGAWPADPPVEVWSVNYPGYGGSTGPAAMASIPPAALAAYGRLAEVAAGRPILVAGNSIGTTAALHVAANRPVAGVLLRNPPPLRQLIVGRHGWWNLWLGAWLVAQRVPDGLDSLANAARCTAPAAIISAGADHVVPPAYQRLVIDSYAGPKDIVEIPLADHNTPIGPAEEARLRAWVAERLRSPRSAATR